MIKFLFSILLLCNLAQAKVVDIMLTEDNSVIFNQPVSEEYVSKKILELLIKSSKTKPLYLVLDTPGGSVPAGLKFIDLIKSLKIPVHTLTFFAASMGYQFVQELGTRYITPSGVLMSHRGAISGMSGQVPGELNSRLNFIQAILDGMSERAAKRVKLSKAVYDAMIVNELWVSGESAVNTNHADFLANVTCDKSLINKVYKQEVITIFGAAFVKFSACPLVSAPLSMTFAKEVKSENFEKIKQIILYKKRKITLNL